MTNTEYLKPIIKSLIKSQDVDFWIMYRNQFKIALTDIDEVYDKTINFISKYFNNFDELPKEENIVSLLNIKGEVDSAQYIEKLLKNESISIILEKDKFILLLEESKAKTLINKVSFFIDELTNVVTTTEQTEKGYINLLDYIMLKHSALKSTIAPESKAVEYMLHESLGMDAFNKIYDEIMYKKNNADKIYLEMPFESFSDVGIKQGDLFINGGYTSNGKSVLLRYLSYYYAVYHSRNVLFMTLEMDADHVLSLFVIMHANNKNIFPNTPKISYTKYKKGNLTKEEEHFIKNVAAPDLTNNQNYGVLNVYKPNKTKFTLQDVKNVISEKQHDMPIDILAIDYLTLLHPVDGNKSPSTEDYNQMIKEFKQLLLTNLNPKGNKYPLIGLTAAQISRQGYNECLKSNEHYNLSALYQYSELEKSADIVCTILRTPTHAKEKKVKLQFLKNRDGVIPIEPKELMLDVEYGGNILDVSALAELNVSEILKSITI